MGVISKMIRRWKVRWIVQRAITLMALIHMITLFRTRSKMSFPRFDKDKEANRNFYKAWEFFLNYGPDANAKKFLRAKKVVVEIFEWLCNDACAKKDLALCYRIQHLQLTAQKRPHAGQVATQYLRFYRKKLVPLSAFDILKKYVVLIKRLFAAWSNLSKSRMQLIRVRLRHFTLFASAMSAVFVIAGYAHTHIVYGYFGVEATQFFTLNDYLAASIGQIWLALIAIAGYPLAVWIMYRHGFQLGLSTVLFDFHKFATLVLVLLAPSVGFFAFLYFAYVQSWSAFWFLAPFSVYVLLQVWVQRAAARIFKNPFHMITTVMLALMFAASVVSQSVKQIASIKNAGEEKVFTVETAEKTFTDEEFVFLGGNERYIFLLKKDGSAEIIPLVQIKSMNMCDSKSAQPPLLSDFHRRRFFFPGKTGAVYCR
ncbi:MAG: hypothetical protein MPJ81_00695 [Gammaproteobacteria bacterium]|nr:hypothetical protein [Gammaproteobacteria bacterium]